MKIISVIYVLKSSKRDYEPNLHALSCT